MKSKKDEKWLDENISKAVGFGEVQFDAEKWKEKYNLKESISHAGIGKHKYIWRYFMKHKVTKYSAAAIIILAFLLVLFNPFGGSKYGGVVLAEVAQKMENIKLFVCKEHTLNIDIEKGDVTLETNGIKYLSTYGVIDEQYTTDGNLGYRFCVSREQMKIVGLFPKWIKGYVEIPLSETLAPLIDRLTPYGLVEHFMTVEHKNLGRSNINGREVEGFEAIDVGLWPIQDTFNILCPVEQITWKLWIDVKSSLPVQIDYEVILGIGQFSGWKRLKMECKAYDFEFYQEVPEDMFVPDIPEGYKPINIIKQIIPVDTILKFFKSPNN
ncbi:MAG: hypothetical protein JXA96_10040 [Sedimentisphaerales bacterium]|nr:hypothetical protein [Sedimentisphaerales bacterium]